MPVVIQDTFTDTNGTQIHNHTPDVGSQWETTLEFRAPDGVGSQTSITEINNNELSPGGSRTNRNPTNLGTAEYDVELDMGWTSGSNLNSEFTFGALCARFSSTGSTYSGVDYYSASYHGIIGNRRFRIHKHIAGVRTELAANATAPSTAVVYHWLFEVRNASKRLVVTHTGGTIADISTLDNDITQQGRVALNHRATSGNGFADNFVVTTVGGGVSHEKTEDDVVGAVDSHSRLHGASRMVRGVKVGGG